MQLDFNLNDNNYPQNVRILPGNADSDRLHDIVVRLPDIENPSLCFSTDVRSGKYNDMTDEEFEAMLHAMKSLNALWFDRNEKKTLPSAGVFDLLIRLIENYIQHAMSEYNKDSLHQFK